SVSLTPRTSTLLPYTTLFRSLGIDSLTYRVAISGQDRITLTGQAGTTPDGFRPPAPPIVVGLAARPWVNTENRLRVYRTCIVQIDRKSTRLNSSHQIISYAVF